MNIPFLDLLEKVKARFMPATRSSVPPPLPAPVNKPESDKLSKTVVPNAVQTIAPDATSSAAPAGTRSHMVAMGATVNGRTIYRRWWPWHLSRRGRTWWRWGQR